MSYDRVRLGMFLRKTRELKKLRLCDVAEKVGVSIPFISEVERGLRPISPGKLDAWARFLELSRTAYLFVFRTRGRLPPAAERAHLLTDGWYDQAGQKREKSAHR